MAPPAVDCQTKAPVVLTIVTECRVGRFVFLAWQHFAFLLEDAWNGPGRSAHSEAAAKCAPTRRMLTRARPTRARRRWAD